MKHNNLADFLKEKTGKKLESNGDGVSGKFSEVIIRDVTEIDAKNIFLYVKDFYLEHGFNMGGTDDTADFFWYLERGNEWRTVTYTYAKFTNSVFITASSIPLKGTNK